MGCWGWLTNPDEMPVVEIICYECNRSVHGAPNDDHPDCVKDGRLRINLEIDAEHEVR